MNNSTLYNDIDRSASANNMQIPSPMTILGLTAGALTFLIGAAGNIIVVIIYLRFPPLRKAHNIFIINLALIDLFILSLLSPFYLASYLDDGGEKMRENAGLCVLAGCVVNIVYSVSVGAMCVIAVNRCACVAFPIASKKFFTRGRCVFIVLASWVFYIIVYLPPAFGWGKMKFKEDISFCGQEYEGDSKAFNIFSGILGLAVPSLITIFCYVKLLKIVRQSNRRLQTHASDVVSTDHARSESIRKSEMKLTSQMFVIVGVFYVTWSPQTFVVRVFNIEVSYVLKLMFNGLLAINSAVNPFIYFHFNPAFRGEVVRIFRCRKPGGNEMTQVAGSTCNPT